MSCGTESAYAEERRVQISTESVLRYVNFTRILADDETLSGTPTITVSPTGPTIASPVVTTATYTNDYGTTVAIGKAVQFRVSGGTAGTEYLLTVTCTTSSGDTRAVKCYLTIV